HPHTPGFRTQAALLLHHTKHHAEFGGLTVDEYETRADAFVGGPLGAHTLHAVRVNGDIVRYNTQTQEYAALAGDGFIKTYMIPNPAIHGLPTNLDYFNATSV